MIRKKKKQTRKELIKKGKLKRFLLDLEKPLYEKTKDIAVARKSTVSALLRRVIEKTINELYSVWKDDGVDINKVNI